jgi:alkylated DNA repair protein alkB family protein 6
VYQYPVRLLSAKNYLIAPIDDFLLPSTVEKLFQMLNLAGGSFIQLRGRKCMPYGGKVTESGFVPSEDIPPWLVSIMDIVYIRFLKPLNFPKPNHALINVYEPGEGIMPHEDGPAYTPYAAILSLGSASVFEFHTKTVPRSRISQIYLPVGSLLLFTGDAYTSALHAFPFNKVDELSPSVVNRQAVQEHPCRLGLSHLVGSNLFRGKRISITMRHVPPS